MKWRTARPGLAGVAAWRVARLGRFRIPQIFRRSGGSEATFLDEIAQLFLEFQNIFLGGAVARCVWVESGAAGLVEHPNGSLTVAECDFSTDECAGQGESVHGGADKSGGHGSEFFFLFGHDFGFLDQLDFQV